MVSRAIFSYEKRSDQYVPQLILARRIHKQIKSDKSKSNLYWTQVAKIKICMLNTTGLPYFKSKIHRASRPYQRLTYIFLNNCLGKSLNFQ
jgi:hypothetical protein